jgi:hypothetical protein
MTGAEIPLIGQERDYPKSGGPSNSQLYNERLHVTKDLMQGD